MKRLRKYQSDAVKNYISKFSNVLFFWEMRLGKTLMACRFILNKNPDKTLIVAPYSAHVGWIEELKSENNVSPIILDGTSKERIERLHTEFNTKEKAIFLMDHTSWQFCNVEDYAWDCVIIDEAQSLSNPKSKFTKFFMKKMHDIPLKGVLSGTEFKKDLLQLFGPIAWCEDRVFGYTNFYQFRLDKFHQEGWRWEPNKGTRDWIADRMSNWCSKLKRKDVDIGVDKVYQKRICDFSRDYQRTYDAFEKTMVLGEKRTKFAGVQFSWLKQMCGGFVDGTMLWTGKIKLLKHILHYEVKDSPVIIWASFINEIKHIEHTFGIHSIMGSTPKDRRRRLIKKFQEGKIKRLVLQPQCMKLGVDLSKADVAIYYSQPNGVEDREQSEDRVVPGEEKKKNRGKLIIDLLAKDSVEFDIYENHRIQVANKVVFHKIMKRLEKKYALHNN